MTKANVEATPQSVESMASSIYEKLGGECGDLGVQTANLENGSRIEIIDFSRPDEELHRRSLVKVFGKSGNLKFAINVGDGDEADQLLWVHREKDNVDWQLADEKPKWVDTALGRLTTAHAEIVGNDQEE